jgi:hypothetical protein
MATSRGSQPKKDAMKYTREIPGKPMESRHSAWMILAAAVLWGTTGTAQALAPQGTQPMAVGAARGPQG